MNRTKSFPRPTRRAAVQVRAHIELTPAGVQVAAASAARALAAAEDDYMYLAGFQQEGARISRAEYDVVAVRHARATRLQDACDTLTA